MAKNKLLELRMKLGVSQVRMAALCNYKHSMTISQIERGQRKMTIRLAKELVKLAKQNNIPYDLEDFI